MGNKWIRICIIGTVIGILLVIASLNALGLLGFANHAIEITAGTPDTSCSVDADCVLKLTSCDYCACKEPVNKDWDVFCPFKKKNELFANRIYSRSCGFCSYGAVDYDYELRCVENQCKIRWNEQVN